MEIVGQDICNIWKQKCKPSLRRSEKWCPTCKGLGASFVDISFKQRYVTLRRCFLCGGEGKVDWLVAITKRPAKEYPIRSALKDVRLKCPGHMKCKKTLKRLWQNTKNFSKGPWHPEFY